MILMVLMWWFMYTGSHYVPVVVGPFRSEKACNTIRQHVIEMIPERDRPLAAVRVCVKDD
jgi:hypothetical protein